MTDKKIIDYEEIIVNMDSDDYYKAYVNYFKSCPRKVLEKEIDELYYTLNYYNLDSYEEQGNNYFIDNEIDLTKYINIKKCSLSKMKKSELIEYCKKLQDENKEIKINTMKCCKDLEKEKEEITNKYNEGYDLLCKTKTNMEEMLDKIEELKEENKELKYKVNLDKDKIENYDNLDFKIYKYNEDTIDKLKKDNKLLEEQNIELNKDYEDIKRRNLNKKNEIEKVKKQKEELDKYKDFIDSLYCKIDDMFIRKIDI